MTNTNMYRQLTMTICYVYLAYYVLILNDHSQNDYKSSPIAATANSIQVIKDDSDTTNVLLWSP